MLLWTLLMLMTGAATIAVIVPLTRSAQKNTDTPTRDNVTFYQAQLLEIERDLKRDLISADAAEQARIEAGRRLLQLRAVEDQKIKHKKPQDHQHTRHVRIIAGLMVVCIPLVSVGLYLKLGNPDYQDQPLSERLKVDVAKLDILTATARVEASVAKNPDDVKGWQILAPIYLRTSRYKDAVQAFENMVRLSGETPELMSSYAEALVLENAGVVPNEARVIFKTIIDAKKGDQNRLNTASDSLIYDKSHYFLALSFEQEGRKDEALSLYMMLIERAKNYAQPPVWIERVNARIQHVQTQSQLPNNNAPDHNNTQVKP